MGRQPRVCTQFAAGDLDRGHATARRWRGRGASPGDRSAGDVRGVGLRAPSRPRRGRLPARASAEPRSDVDVRDRGAVRRRVDRPFHPRRGLVVSRDRARPIVRARHYARGWRRRDGRASPRAFMRQSVMISARQVRLVSDPGDGGGDAGGEKRSHEIISTIVAIRRAKQAGLDLVEVNPRARPARVSPHRITTRSDTNFVRRSATRVSARWNAADTTMCQELEASARISANDLRSQGGPDGRFLEQGHKVTLRVAFKSNDGVAQKLRPKAGAILYDEFRALLGPHRVEVEGKMIGPNHYLQVVRARGKKGKTKSGKTENHARARGDGDGTRGGARGPSRPRRP